MPVRVPDGKSSVFLDACAMLNYIKPLILRKLVPKKPLPDRVMIIKGFIIKCGEKGLGLQSSNIAYDQSKKYRAFFREEFGHVASSRSIDRVISATEHKIKGFFSRIKVHPNLSNKYFNDVESFFQKFQKDPRMLDLWRRKCEISKQNFPSPLPDKSDMEIFSQALTLDNLMFVTNDGHFDVIYDEIEKEFSVTVISHNNAYARMGQWGW